MADQSIFETSLLDESFNPKDTRNYGMGIILNETRIGICILDFRRNKFLSLHAAVRKELQSADSHSVVIPSFNDFLNSVSSAIPWIRSSFKMVKVAYDGKKSTLVPGALYDPNGKEQYLKFNFMQEPDEKILADHLMPLDAWQVFAVPEPIIGAAATLCRGSRVVDASSVLIESIWINYKNRINEPHVFLHVRGPLFDLMIFDGRQMSYFNTFSFTNPEDVAYYLIFVLEQLNFNPEAVPVVLLGNIEMGDGLSELLPRYIRNIETGRRNDAYRYSYMMNQLPPHFCFPLLNLFSCGL